MNDFAGDWRMAAAMGLPHPDPNENRWSARDYLEQTFEETGYAGPPAPNTTPSTIEPAPAPTPQALAALPQTGWLNTIGAYAQKWGVHPAVVVVGGVAILAGIGTAIYFATREEKKP